MRFDREKFFDAYRAEFGRLSQQQTDGLSDLLRFIEADPYITNVNQAAFLLGTTKHETAHTFKPIHEYGSKKYFIQRYGGQTRKGKELGNDTAEEGYYYAGKGYPQTTGESNYERAEAAIRREYPEVVADFERRTGRTFDLTVGDQPNDANDPQNMLDPAIAYVTMSYGSRTGMFTGYKLSQFVTATKKDYTGSRKVINGRDKAALIAGYCVKFEKILRASLEKDDPFITTNTNAGLIAGIAPVEPVEAPEATETTQETSQSVKLTENDQPSGEVTVKTETKTSTGTQTAEVTTTQNVVIEKKEGWFRRKWKEIVGFATGNSLLDGFSEKLAQVQALGLPTRFWTNLIYFTIGGAVIYLAFDWYRDYQDRKLTHSLIDANSTPTNMVQTSSAQNLETYDKDPNWQVIRK